VQSLLPLIALLLVVAFAASPVAPEAALRAEVTAHPEAVEAWIDLGNLALAREDTDSALESFQRALQVAPQSADALNGLGVARLQQGGLLAAQEWFELAVVAQPDHASALANLGRVHLLQGDAAEGVEALALALRSDPGHVGAAVTWGEVHRAAKVPHEALPAVRAALERHPEDPRLLLALAQLLQAEGRHLDAVPVLQQAQERAPDSVEVRRALGLSLLHLGHWPGAEEAYRAALKLRPEDAQLHLELATVYARSSEAPTRALAYAARAAELDGELTEAWTLLGDLLEDQGDLAGAEEAWRAALSAAPGDCATATNLGRRLLEEGRLPEAESLLDQCLERDPRFVPARLNRGLVRAHQGRCDEAARDLALVSVESEAMAELAEQIAARCE